jgi:hypothetical protein
MEGIAALSDVDNTLREKKGAVRAETIKAIREFQRAGGVSGVHTGAPSHHIPREVPAHIILGESGGVMEIPERGGRSIYEPGRAIIARLRVELGIQEEDGLTHTPWGPAILEGPRYTSLTFLTGAPPHYPGVQVATPLEVLHAGVMKTLGRLGLREVWLSVGSDTSYSWLDVRTMSKARAVANLLPMLREGDIHTIYVLGDDRSDFEAMLVPDATPVGFANSIQEIRALARERGVYVDLPGPTGGVAEFFRRLNSGQL